MQFGSAVLTLLMLMRIGYVLSANPIGEFAQELVYLRVRELRQAALYVFLVILVELVEQVMPLLVRQGILSPLPDAPLYLNTGQAILILAATTTILLVVRRYTHRALDRRIRESMETLAYLEGQRRRRRSMERGDWERGADDE